MRGSIRSKVELENILVTRPPNIESKHGVNGEPVELLTNYFQLIRKPNWMIYRYRVDFKPEVHLDKLRNFLIATQKEMLGGYLFDGTQIFITRKLEQDVVEKVARTRDETEYMIIFKHTGVVAMTENTSLQVINLILRRAMGGLKLQLVGRNFYDADAKVSCFLFFV